MFDTKTVNFKFDGKKVKAHIRKNITINEHIDAVTSIIDFVFDPDNEDSITSLNCAAIEFAYRFYIMDVFTDLDFDKLAGEDGAYIKIWEISKRGNLYDKICKFAKKYVDNIKKAAELGINARIGYLQNKTDFNMLLNKFSDKLDGFSKNFSQEDASSILSVVKKLDGIDQKTLASRIVDTIVKKAPVKDGGSPDKSKLN